MAIPPEQRPPKVFEVFQTRLVECASHAQMCLQKAISEFDDHTLAAPMRYACQGGKGLRAFLVMESARLHDIPDNVSSRPAAAIEAMHAYSLVHDDLPCMDDDDLRRGQPTVHIKWDEATAVLVGDGLQSLAFSLLSQRDFEIAPNIQIDLIAQLAAASGAGGMVGGQALDIAAESAEQPYAIAEITKMQAQKTGALIEWSAMAGPRIAGQDPAAMQEFARSLGLAFQIADDILDVTGDSDRAGKRVGKDADAGKATFVSLLGVKDARAEAEMLVLQAERALAPYGSAADTLREAARFVISREV